MATATAPARVRAEPRPLATPAAPGPRRSAPSIPRRSAPSPVRRTPARGPHRTVAFCFILVVGSLLSVVAANAYLTQGQVRLTRMQQQLSTDLGRHRDLELEVARSSDPSKVVGEARSHGLVAPNHVTDLPQVSVSGSTATTTAPSGGTTADRSTGSQ